MTPDEIVALIAFLDQLFQLGGQLVAAAIQRAPVLSTTSLPDLSAMDQARTNALKTAQ